VVFVCTYPYYSERNLKGNLCVIEEDLCGVQVRKSDLTGKSEDISIASTKKLIIRKAMLVVFRNG